MGLTWESQFSGRVAGEDQERARAAKPTAKATVYVKSFKAVWACGGNLHWKDDEESVTPDEVQRQTKGEEEEEEERQNL